MKSYKFIIKGTVQKVYYRKTVCDNAKKENYNGYIKNLENGDVEACITCKEKDLETFIKILKKGSAKSIVTNITQTKCDKIFDRSFSIVF